MTKPGVKQADTLPRSVHRATHPLTYSPTHPLTISVWKFQWAKPSNPNERRCQGYHSTEYSVGDTTQTSSVIPGAPVFAASPVTIIIKIKAM